MAYFEDLSVYSYASAPPAYGALNVGWLAAGRPFPTGDTSEAFRAALADLCNTYATRFSMGHHACEICPDASWGDPYYHDMGNGEIWVRDVAGIWYAAPRLIIHYVEGHRYWPPTGFVEAVMSPSEIGKQEWFEFSEQDDYARVRDHDRQQRDLPGGRPSEAEIDQIMLRAIHEIDSKRPWWRRLFET